jgi:hypothetical protein
MNGNIFSMEARKDHPPHEYPRHKDRDLKFRIQKISDEGSQDPFSPRIWFGIINLRDEVLKVYSL